MAEKNSSTVENSQAYFKKVAGNWDEISAGYFGEPVRKIALEKAYLHSDMVVMDVGAGTGFLSAGLAPLVKHVHVVDASADMLNVARKNLKEFNNVTFHETNGINLPFPDNGLNAVFANMYLHHMPDPLAAIKEIVRVLRPGGRLMITDMDSHPYEWLKDEMADVWQGFDRNQIRAWFQEAGLVNVIVDCTSQTCCAESNDPVLTDSQQRDAKISIFFATGTKRLEMKKSVLTHYGNLAASASCDCSISSNTKSNADTVSCCSKEETPYVEKAGYTKSDLINVPEEAANFSLGCGNPLAMANLKPGETVLDIGSGGGLDSFIAADRVGPDGQVIGVDMNPVMLERAQKSQQKNGITNVEFRYGTAENLPAENGEVDVIISNCVINLTEDKGQVFAESFRVLKNGGRLEVSDMVTSKPVPDEVREDELGWSECVTGALPENEYVDLIKQAGFEIADLRRSTGFDHSYGIEVYSLLVSAVKPFPAETSSGCCGGA